MLILLIYFNNLPISRLTFPSQNFKLAILLTQVIKFPKTDKAP